MLKRIHPRYNPLVNTGRTSCSGAKGIGCNFQQLPKNGGIRELFVAAPDHTFIISDYSAIELVTLAQITYMKFGESRMMEMINDGVDLHRYYASVLHGITPEAVTKQQRQEAKAANFGFPGGLGIETFIEFSRGYDLELSTDHAQNMKDAWFEAFPEMRLYMNEEDNSDESVFTMSGRKRANATYCARKNTPFQGSAADGAKIALYNLDLHGFKLVGFVHDEIISEVPVCDAERLLPKQEQIMIDAMRIITPDVKVAVESVISNFYTK